MTIELLQCLVSGRKFGHDAVIQLVQGASDLPGLPGPYLLSLTVCECAYKACIITLGRCRILGQEGTLDCKPHSHIFTIKLLKVIIYAISTPTGHEGGMVYILVC